MVLVFAEHDSGGLKKSAFEAAQFGQQIADQQGTSCTAVVLGNCSDAASLGNVGVTKVLEVEGAFDAFDDSTYAGVLAHVFKQQDANVLVLSHSAIGKCLLGKLAVKLGAGSVSSAKSFASDNGDMIFTRPAFSGKANAKVKVTTPNAVISLMSNAVVPNKSDALAEVQQVQVEIPAARTQMVEVKKVSGGVPLAEADLVVSAGRGMKEPGNWGIIEELAEELGAATACSRPVADSDWRPHHEHVGQTGQAIRPNLYIAIGISGAIQHLAGVNSSKTIVVINKDPEAPFFKAADYGVEADLFDVVPKLTDAIRRFKNA